MNEFGIDSLQFSAGQQITQSQVDQIEYIILKSGLSSAGVPQMLTPAYFSQTMSTFQFFEPTVRLMKQNNKPIGAYFFSYAWNRASAEYEAQIMCDSMDALTDKPDWPLFIDWESTGSSQMASYGAYEALIYHGITPTAAIVQDVAAGWKSVVESRGYHAGLYTSGSLARDLFGSSFIQQQRSAGLYYWEAAWGVSQPFLSCDVWQYAGDQSWNGVTVDFNRVMDDRIWNLGPGPGPGPSSSIPIWLKLKMARSDQNAKCTILL